MGSGVAYDVSVDYRLTGIEKSLSQVKSLDATTKQLASSMQWVKRAGIAMGSALVFGKMNDALIGSNASLQSMQTSMATVIGMNLGKSLAAAEPEAARLVAHYRELAKSAPGTSRDFLAFNNQIMGAVTNAGGNLEAVKKLTGAGVIASTALGFKGDVAGRDIQQALTGNVSAQTPFIKMMLGSEAKIAEFNRKSGKERVNALITAFDSPVLKDAAKKYGQSYEGQLSTLKDTAEMTFAAVGQPLFKQLTSWLAKINAWADSNQGKISSIARSLGEGMASGARWLLKAGTYIVSNAKTIMLMGGIFVGLKGITGMLGGGGLSATFASLAKNGNLAAVALGGLAIGLPALFKQMDRVFGGGAAWAMSRPGVAGAVSHGIAQQAGAGMGGMMGNMLGDLGASSRGKAAFAAGLASAAGGALASAMLDNGRDAVKPRKNVMNVTIKRVEVVADDADRFIHGLNKAVGRELASPSQSVFMPRGNT